MDNLDKVRQGKGKRHTTRSLPSLEWLEHRVTPSTFHVNTLLDTDAVNFKTGKDSSGHVSLRSAIMAADAQGGSNKIILPAGTFTLTLARRRRGQQRDRRPGHQGQRLDPGPGRWQTIIDGNNLDRVIQVQGGTVSITGVTIQHGRVMGDGGGILNSGGRLVAQLEWSSRTTWRSGRSAAPASRFGGGATAAAATRAAGSSTRPGRSAW